MRKHLLAIVLLVGAAPALAQTDSVTVFELNVADQDHARAGPPPPVAPDLRRPPFFLVEHAGKRMYLLGSIHVLPLGGLPLPQHVEAAFAESDLVAFEVDISSANSFSAAVLAQIADEEVLYDVATEETLLAVEEALLKHGLDPGFLGEFEPWYAAVVLMGLDLAVEGGSSASAGDPSSGSSEMVLAPGVDHYLFERAGLEGKQRVYLESLADQFNAFDGLPVTSQLRYLEEVLHPSESWSYADLLEAWGAGDIKRLIGWTQDSMANSGELMKALLARRNRAWMPRIEAMLANPARTSMVVVGAAHLVGAESVVELLQKAGYTVRRL